MKIHVGDNVLVIAGKYRGKKGTVIRLSDKSGKITVEKINIRTRHIKKSAGQPGQKIQYEAPFDASNAIVICPHCSKPTRVAHAIIEGEKRRKQRVCKKCAQSLDTNQEKKKTSKKR